MASSTLDLSVAARDTALRRVHLQGASAGGFFARMRHAFAQAARRQGALRAAQEMRRVARSFEGSQPNLAAELQAAAMRCEGLLDERR